MVIVNLLYWIKLLMNEFRIIVINQTTGVYRIQNYYKVSHLVKFWDIIRNLEFITGLKN